MGMDVDKGAREGLEITKGTVLILKTIMGRSSPN